MSAARRSDGLLPRAGFLKAAELAKPGKLGATALAATLHASMFAPLNRAQNTIDLLLDIGVLADDGGVICCQANLAGVADAYRQIRTALARSYAVLLERVVAPNLFQLSAADGALRANSTKLPGKNLGYPYALVEFDIFRRKDTADVSWTVSPDFVETFLDRLRSANYHLQLGSFTLQALKEARRFREEVGRQAEEWVVQWERKRLVTHPFIDLIRSISDEDASAGFDVASFDGVSGLVHDRFIEVKGYWEEHSFYWSEQEIGAARALGMRYWLYLVDRRSMNVPGYEPERVQDPVSYFIDRDPVGWAVASQGQKFTRITETA